MSKKYGNEVSVFSGTLSLAEGHSINQAEVCFYSAYLIICKQFSELLKKFKLPVNSEFILASRQVGVWLIELLPHTVLFCFPFLYFHMQE